MEPSMTIEEQFKRLNDAKGAKSLMKKYLTKEVFDELKNKKTKYGGTLSQCINSGTKEKLNSISYHPQTCKGCIIVYIVRCLFHSLTNHFRSK